METELFLIFLGENGINKFQVISTSNAMIDVYFVVRSFLINSIQILFTKSGFLPRGGGGAGEAPP